MQDTSRECLKKILNLALNGQLSLSDFYSMYEEDWGKNPLYDAILDNIETALEHKPGFLFSKKTNLSKFKKMEEYRVMLFDYNFLEKETNNSFDELLVLRNKKIRNI